MTFKLNIWLRAIRFRFLAASAIAVTNGLVLSYWYEPSSFNIFYAVLTYIGIFCLHSSVDLLNDYWDYKRGIDLHTKKTRFSGGTGVLPGGLLKSKDVYFVGVLFLILGLMIGGFFVLVKGYIIALILAFATLSIVLYSSKLVNLGLGELFVGIKGLLIVVGSFYVQTTTIIFNSVILGAIIGILSSLVLYINSIPDIKPDRENGRKTLAIILEKYSNRDVFLFVLSLFFSVYLLSGIFFYYVMGGSENGYGLYGFLPNLVLLPICLVVIYKFYKYLFNLGNQNEFFYETIMEKTVLFSRLYGLALVVGISILYLLHH